MSRSTKRSDLQRLPTERPNPATANLDTESALKIAETINHEDAKVAAAVKKALPQIARAIDWIADALRQGGRLIYVGAGTSGRIAALDAVECPPTFNTPPEAVQFVIAGGHKALAVATEADEDSRELGRKEIAGKKPGKRDVVVGIAASGRTPFTVAAVELARSRGARTVAVTCNHDSPLERAADLAIVTVVGPEVISGSSRMKAGTAQKMVLNMLSTGAMTRLGYVYGNLMVNVHPKNEKLSERAVSIVQKAAKVSRIEASRGFRQAGNRVPVAIVMLVSRLTRLQAERALNAASGDVRRAIASTVTAPGRPTTGRNRAR